MPENQVRVHVVQEKDLANFSMRYIDPMTGKPVKRTAGTSLRREAVKRAAQWEAELREGRYNSPSKITWDEFRARYEAEHVPSLAAGTAVKIDSTFSLVERLLDPKRLRDLSPARISYFQSQLRAGGRSEATIAGYLAHLKAALRWAKDVGMLHEASKVAMPKRAKGSDHHHNGVLRGPERPDHGGGGVGGVSQGPGRRPADGTRGPRRYHFRYHWPV